MNLSWTWIYSPEPPPIRCGLERARRQPPRSARRIVQQRQAYTFLLRVAEQLLRLNALFWTERWLLRLVRYLHQRWLVQLEATET